MNQNEFESVVLQDENLRHAINRAAYRSSPPGYVGFGLTEAAAITLLYPIVRYVVNEIGLPWLVEAKRYSELWRIKFRRWVDEQYAENELDKSHVVGAGLGLKEELEKIHDEEAKKSWERLAQLIKANMSSSEGI